MFVAPAMRRQYPLLTAFILRRIPAVRLNARVYRAFRQHAELSRRSSSRALSRGGNPEVNFRVMSGANGQFAGSTTPNTVWLAKSICDRFEGNATDRADTRMHLLIESTILHEMVHWGDWIDGVDQAGEEGKSFERAAYGRDIDRYW